MAEKILKCPVCEKTEFSLFLEVKDYFLSQEDFSIEMCNSCGFKFVNPRPGKLEIGRYYQSDEYLSHDAKKRNLISWIYILARSFSIRSKYKIVGNYVHKGKILDIGCGTGEFLKYCKSKGFEISGVEPNEKARVYAQQVNRIPVNNNLDNLIQATGLFNCITMWHVLEHVHELNETLEQIKGLLVPGGILIVAVPNCNSWDARKYGKFWAAYDVPRHLYHFTDKTLNKLVTSHGFELKKMIPQMLDAFYVSLLSEKYRSGQNRYFKSLVLGFWSNVLGRKQQLGYSSQIFILATKKS